MKTQKVEGKVYELHPVQYQIQGSCKGCAAAEDLKLCTLLSGCVDRKEMTFHIWKEVE